MGKVSLAKTLETISTRAQGLGETLRMVNEARLDAYLWLERSGECDGECHGGPGAGQWWQEMALELVQNRQR